MLPSVGAVTQGVLLVAGAAWCVFIIRRLPNDLAELGREFKKYQASRDPHVLGTIKEKDGRRERFRKEAATRFWTTLALQLLFFWPVTLIAAFVVVAVLCQLASHVIRVF
jgi:hypothetical protein